MIIPRRIATMAALVVLFSSLAATPLAYAANCRAGFVGPYGTACGGDEEQEPVVVTATPPRGNTNIKVKVVAISAAVLATNSAAVTSSAKVLGRVLFNGAPYYFSTLLKVTPQPGKRTVITAVPGNPVRATVTGFQRSATTVEVRVQASGGGDSMRLGYMQPNNGEISLPTVTVRAGDSATYTLNEWVALRDGSVDFASGLISQKVVTISGTGVATGKVNRLAAAL
jgi:hypothetical protein